MKSLYYLNKRASKNWIAKNTKDKIYDIPQEIFLCFVLLTDKCDLQQYKIHSNECHKCQGEWNLAK